ncbi:MAG: zinc-ribbon domain-containing protein [Methanobrevibacter sp.]|nr:zinc-ribbon domain-containing protein [Methanobrevibacter sp.]
MFILLQYCPNCGTENTRNSKFCQNCGTSLSNLQNINEGSEGSENNEKLLIAIAIVLVIAIAIVGVSSFVLFNDNNSNSNDNNNNDNVFNNGDNANLNSNSNLDTVTSSSIPLSAVYGLAVAYSANPSSSIHYKGVTLTRPQCLYIFSKAIDMKNRGDSGNINFRSFASPDNPLYGVSTSSLTRSQYVDMAQRTYRWMDNHGRAPNYTGIVVAGSPDFGYEGLILAFAIVIIRSESGSLPSSINW